MRASAHSGHSRYRVFVLDPAPLMSVALRRVVEESAELTWSGESADPARATLDMQKMQPDLAIIDIAFADKSGIELIHDIRAASPKTRIVVFTAMAGSVYGDRCLRAGASGFVSKRQPTATLLKALHRAVEGGVWLDEDLATQMLSRRTDQTREPIDSLSAMEFEVFRLIADGQTSIAIAKRLHRSVRTIETYRHRIKIKLGLANATELAQYAMRCLMEWPTGGTPKYPHLAENSGTAHGSAGKHSEVAGPAASPAEIGHPHAEGVRGRALIVEDNLPTSSALAVTCRRLGFRTEIARTADEANTKLDDHPDVILLDLKLAGGDDGAEVLRNVRKRNLPARVAVVTGMEESVALEQVESLAPDAMFRKPVRFSELEKWLRSHPPIGTGASSGADRPSDPRKAYQAC